MGKTRIFKIVCTAENYWKMYSNELFLESFPNIISTRASMYTFEVECEFEVMKKFYNATPGIKVKEIVNVDFETIQ